jgi:hypothetical protein
MRAAENRARGLAREAGRAVGGGKLALWLLGGGVVAGGIYLATRPKTAIVAPAGGLVAPGGNLVLPPQTTPISAVWREITLPVGQTGSIPAGVTAYLAVQNPSSGIVTLFSSLSNPPAAIASTIATAMINVWFFPVGTPQPANYPNDGFGTTAARLTMKLLQPFPYNGAANFRVWTQ